LEGGRERGGETRVVEGEIRGVGGGIEGIKEGEKNKERDRERKRERRKRRGRRRRQRRRRKRGKVEREGERERPRWRGRERERDLIIFAIPTVAIRMFTSAFFFAPWGIPMTRAIPALHNLGLLTKFWVIVIPRNSIFIEIAPEVLPAIVPLAFFDAIIIEGGRQQGVALVIICVFTIPILFNCVMVRPLVMVGPARIKFIRSPPKGNVPRKRPVLLVDK